MSIWELNPRLWHTHPLTEPIGIVVAVAGVLLAALVGWAISWWNRRPLRPKQRHPSN